MENIFLKLLNMSLSALWIIGAAVLLRLIFRRAPKWTRLILWALVAVRLCLPFSVESRASLVPSAESVTITVERGPRTAETDPIPAETVPVEAESPAVTVTPSDPPEINSDVPAAQNAEHSALADSSAPTPENSADTAQIWLGIASRVWLFGLIAMAVYGIVSYLVIRRRVRASIKTENGVYICDEIKSPFILGVFAPKIYVPSNLEGEALSCVLSHERAHIKRLDHIWKPLGFLLLAVYWFNPAVWLSYILLCRDIELACDEKVIAKLTEGERKLYSETLLSFSVPRRIIAACPVAFGEVGVKERIKSVLSYKKPAFWIILAVLIASVAAAVLFLTSPVKETMLYDWTSTVKAEGIRYAAVTFHGSGVHYIDGFLLKSKISELADVLNEIRPGDISRWENEGSYYPVEALDIAVSSGETYFILFVPPEDAEFPINENTYPDFALIKYNDVTYKITNKKLFDFFIEAKISTPFVPYGDYVSSRLVYLTPFSSAIGTDDSGEIYRFGGDSFQIILRDTGGTQASAEGIELNWEESPYTAGDWENMLVPGWIGDISTELLEGARYMYLTEKYRLLETEGEIWLVRLSTSPKGAYVWSIYAIEPTDEVFDWPEYTVTSGENTIKATLISEDIVPSLMVGSVEWLTIDADGDIVPFRVYEGETEKFGSYSIYNTFTGAPLEFVHPSGLAPQTYILQNAAYGGRYIVAVRTDDAYIAFGIRVPERDDDPLSAVEAKIRYLEDNFWTPDLDEDTGELILAFPKAALDPETGDIIITLIPNIDEAVNRANIARAESYFGTENVRVNASGYYPAPGYEYTGFEMDFDGDGGADHVYITGYGDDGGVIVTVTDSEGRLKWQGATHDDREFFSLTTTGVVTDELVEYLRTIGEREAYILSVPQGWWPAFSSWEIARGLPIEISGGGENTEYTFRARDGRLGLRDSAKQEYFSEITIIGDGAVYWDWGIPDSDGIWTGDETYVDVTFSEGGKAIGRGLVKITKEPSLYSGEVIECLFYEN